MIERRKVKKANFSTGNNAISGTNVARDFSEEVDDLIALAEDYLKKSELAKEGSERELYERLASETMDRADRMSKKMRAYL
jgi:hypothetical protein